MKDTDKVLLAHGGGGGLSYQLIKDLIIPAFDNNSKLKELDDAARVSFKNGRLAFSTDSFVVKPMFFPGGDIGSLAVCGTVNDLAMVGAEPLYISVSFIIEEGLSLTILKKVIDSMGKMVGRTGVQVVTGDTKVVEKGSLISYSSTQPV